MIFIPLEAGSARHWEQGSQKGWDLGQTPPVTCPHCLQAPKAKRKVESWERSVGTLGGRPVLSGLVVVKKTEPGSSSQQGQEAPTAGAVKNGKVADPAARTPNTSSLSQLGAYSDSEDSS